MFNCNWDIIQIKNNPMCGYIPYGDLGTTTPVGSEAVARPVSLSTTIRNSYSVFSVRSFTVKMVSVMGRLLTLSQRPPKPWRRSTKYPWRRPAILGLCHCRVAAFLLTSRTSRLLMAAGASVNQRKNLGKNITYHQFLGIWKLRNLATLH